jgi:protein-L-isoaspartate(D-aspartate) O-methyltransferase
VASLLVSLQCSNNPLIPILQKAADQKYVKDRQRMVQEQIVQRGVSDLKVLNALGKVPRHEFIPLLSRPLAYADHPLPIGHNQTISQPYIVAYMTEQLGLKGNEKVLEIGTGSGYQAAILAEIAAAVYSIEILCPLLETAKEVLTLLEYKNTTLKCDDGYKGWPQYAPFDAIIVTAAPDHVPAPLVEQLKVGGKMILPVGDNYQELILITKSQKGQVIRRLLPVRFVPMTGKAQNKDSQLE